MMSIQNIGEWFASIEKKEGKLQIVISGTFPTNGEKPIF